MNMKQIIKFPNTILREKMVDFDFENPPMDPKQLEKDMLEVMCQHDGIGLAANQVGINARMFVMGSPDSPSNGVGIFNPIILATTESVEDNEGCLSFPGIFVNIKRPKAIKAKWQNSSGEWQESEITGIECRCFLHEFDHLEGIVFQDRISPLKWALAVKKIKSKKRKY